MHIENCSSVKLSSDLDVSSTPYNTSVLEEDLALSSSTLGPQDKSNPQEQSEVPTRTCLNINVIYVNEETMDCNYSESTDTRKNHETREEVSSPESDMFECDDEYEKRDTFEDSTKFGQTLESSLPEKSKQLTVEEMIVKSDKYVLSRINKFLSGVPPPPKHTICQSDCSDFLARIKENQEYFYFNPFRSSEEKLTGNDEKTSDKVEEKIVHEPSIEPSFNNHRGRSSLRNLTTAFDACDVMNENTTSVDDESTKENFPENSDDCTDASSKSRIGKNERIESDVSSRLDESLKSDLRVSEVCPKDNTRHVTFKMPDVDAISLCNTVAVEDVKNMPWDLAYKHKTHGIHYNRSKVVEDFEGLTMKLCLRYIGAETQTSCNIWFSKQAPSSVKKRNLLSRRVNGQSPGKRLSHLAKRRRTFSSANLQGLGLVDKKQLLLNVKKPLIRKGKSPRGKSPRGKSPRGKSPRGSAKKRVGLSRVSPSPRKSKLETSKRALFQSPPGERAGPSSRSSLMSTNSQHRIKRALFPNAIPKNEVISTTMTTTTTTASDIKRVLTFEESKKRKSEDDLEGPKTKWAKSLSFDCGRLSGNSSKDAWTVERHSTGNFNMKSETSFQQKKCELSETHRKKLLWAVAEALRARGIGMEHPRFKQCASQLARIVKKYMPDLENPTLPRKPGSTSDRMLRLAKRHVLLIVESKSSE